MIDEDCVFCTESFLRCEKHEIPRCEAGEPYYICMVCKEQLLAVDCMEHSKVHIDEFIMQGLRDP